MISRLVAAAEFAGVDVLTSVAQQFSGRRDPRVSHDGHGPLLRFLGPCLAWGLFRNVYGDASALIRRQVFLELGGYSEDYRIGKDDMDFYSRAILAGYRLEHYPRATYYYRRSKDTIKRRHHSEEAGATRVAKPFLEAMPMAAGLHSLFALGLWRDLRMTQSYLRIRKRFTGNLPRLFRKLAQWIG